MDPRINPYAPGAGSLPPELSGRNEIIEKISIELDRCKNGLAFRSCLLVGWRGVGKTVLLNYLTLKAEAENFGVISIEVSEKRSLPSLIIPALRTALIKLNVATRILKVLGAFVASMKLKYKDIEFGIDLGSEIGIADSGDLESDLIDLFVEVGLAVKEKKTALIIFIDELQYIEEAQFAALSRALHRCTQRQLPLAIVGAGLPQLVGQASYPKTSYAERLFEYPLIGPLTKEAIKYAIVKPALSLGVEYDENALEEICKQTLGYPYFVQEWAKHCWLHAEKSPISLKDVKVATEFAIAELDANFFKVRLARLSLGEKKYLRAMAEIGSGPYRSGDIATILKKEVQAVAPVRARLIAKGMIYSSSHGDNNFTVPLFDDYMKRIMPNLED